MYKPEYPKLQPLLKLQLLLRLQQLLRLEPLLKPEPQLKQQLALKLQLPLKLELQLKLQLQPQLRLQVRLLKPLLLPKLLPSKAQLQPLHLLAQALDQQFTTLPLRVLPLVLKLHLVRLYIFTINLQHLLGALDWSTVTQQLKQVPPHLAPLCISTEV